MATTAVAIGKIELQVRKEQPIPEGWALGKDGNITTDAKEGFNAGLLLPLGGLEVNCLWMHKFKSNYWIY